MEVTPIGSLTEVYFGSVVLPDGGTVRIIGGPTITFDGTNGLLEITGCAGVSFINASDHTQLFIDRPAGSFGLIWLQTAGSHRWRIGVDNAAEGGANAGSNFAIHNRADDGTDLGSALAITRSSKLVTFAGNIVAAGLSLTKDSVNTELILSCYHDTEATTSLINLRKADGSAAAPALVDDNAVLGALNFSGYDGSDWHIGAKIEARINGIPSDGTDMPTDLTFWTTQDNQGSPIQRMVIQRDGRISIGDNPSDTTNALHLYNSERSTVLRATCLLNSGEAAFIATADDTELSFRAFGSTVAGNIFGGQASADQVVLEAVLASSFYIGTHIAAPIIFCQARAEKMRLTTDGRLGIGWLTPGQIIDARSTSSVLGDARYNAMLFDNAEMAAGVGAGLILGGRYTAGGLQTSFAAIWAEKENANEADFAGQLHLGTRVAAGTVSSDLIINSLGNVGVGVVPKTKFTVDGTITLKEQANADGDTAAYGQIWIKTATPNELWFTDDGGTDHQIAFV